MLEARNLTSHTYDQQLAWRVHEIVRARFPLLELASESLGARLAGSTPPDAAN